MIIDTAKLPLEQRLEVHLTAAGFSSWAALARKADMPEGTLRAFLADPGGATEAVRGRVCAALGVKWEDVNA